MGALRDSARSFGDELGDYYVAALEFIDPELVADSPLAEILTAADRRRRKLGERPLYQVEDELNALDEALHFVQRVRSDLPSGIAQSATYIDVDIDTDQKPPEGITPSELWARAMAPGQPATAEQAKAPEQAGKPVAEEAQPRLFEPGDERAKKPQKGRAKTKAAAQKIAKPTAAAAVAPQAKASAEAAQVWRIPADRTREVVARPASLGGTAQPKTPAARQKPAAESRGSSLREAMKQARHSPVATAPAASPNAEAAQVAKPRRSAAPALPESVAWPVVSGMLLIGWQAWLAVFSGWTATRYLTWPRPGLGYELGWAATTGLVLLALVTALLVGRGAWAYRRRTRCLSLIAHFSALVVGADLFAWGLAAKRLGALIDGPVAGHYVLLGFGWAVAWLLTAIHDAMARRTSQRQQERDGVRRV